MEISTQVRIYADFNGLVGGVVDPTRTAVVLDTFGSIRDLSNAGAVLSVGLPLVAYDESDETEDLEGHGTAQYDHKRRWWSLSLTNKELDMFREPARSLLGHFIASVVVWP